MTELYRGDGAPGVIIYNAVMGAPDQLLSASVAHLQAAYAVDVIGAIVRRAGRRPGHEGRGIRHHDRHRGRIRRSSDPSPRDGLLGKAALRSAATMLGADLEPDGIRVATLTIAGQIVAGTAFDPERIAERYWEVVQTTARGRRSFALPGSQ